MVPSSTTKDPKRIRPATLDDLKETELFSEVEDNALALLLKGSFICELGAQERLYPNRSEVDYVYVILSGYLGIWLASRFIDMGENFLAWRGPGQIIGEMRAIGDARSEARISACEPSILLEIRSDIFTDVADSSPRIYRNISRLLMKKMYQERHRSEVIQTATSERKIAQTLLHLAEERCGRIRPESLKDTNRVVIPGVLIQDEIGAYIGVQRETVNRKLREFKKGNIITYNKSKKGSEITILDHHKLEEIAHQANLETDK